MQYKIAAVTQDEHSLSSHFGMAPFYKVYTVENGRVIEEETRPKPYHTHHPEGHSHEHGHGSHHHEDMFAPIVDCQVLLCGGMGSPAYQKAQAAGLEVVMAGGEILVAVQAYLEDRLVSDLRRIHQR